MSMGSNFRTEISTPVYFKYGFNARKFILISFDLSLLVFYVTCNDSSVIYVTAQMCRRTEEDVPTVGLPTP